ncbi:MAG: VOC family protein [Bacteroidota bacterium]
MMNLYGMKISVAGVIVLLVSLPVCLRSQKAAQFPGIARMDNVEIAVGDIQRAQAFYESILGLKFEFYSDEANYGWFRVGGGVLAFHKGDKLINEADMRIFFTVRDIKKAAAFLRSHNVPASGVRELPEHKGWVVDFEDPWGNKLGFFQPSRKLK